MRTPARGRHGILPGALLALALAATTAGAQTDLSRARLVPLGNGLRVLLVPDSTAVAVEVAAWFGAGGDASPAPPAGIARLLEALATDPRGARRVAEHGGSSGSFSTSDVVCFYETLPPDALDLGLEIEAARMSALTVTPAGLDQARARIAAERAGRAESGPAAHGIQRLFGTLAPGTSYDHPASGAGEGLARLTARDCDQAFRTLFGPNRALVTVVGRFDPATAEAAARRALGALPARGGPARKPVAARAAAARARRASERQDLDIALVFTGWRAPAGSDADALALDLLGRVMGAGSESRLVREAIGPDRDLVFAQAGYDGRRDAGLFYAFGVVRPGADSTAAERGLVAGIEKLAAEPVSADELERARRQAEAGALTGWEGVHGRTVALGLAEMVGGDWQGAWTRVERLRGIGAADLQRAAARVLKAENRAVVWVLPRAAAAGGGERGR